MADNEIQIGAPEFHGRTLYAVIWQVTSASALAWNGSALEVENDSDWSTYAIAMAEIGATGRFKAATPALAIGVYAVDIRLQSGGSPATSDVQVGDGGGYWDGSAWHVDANLDEPVSSAGGAGPSTTAVTDLAGGSSRTPGTQTVVNGSNQPIMGAIVQAYTVAAYGANPATATILARATTDSNGHWTLNLPTGAGPCTVIAYYPGVQTAVGTVTV